MNSPAVSLRRALGVLSVPLAAIAVLVGTAASSAGCADAPAPQGTTAEASTPPPRDPLAFAARLTARALEQPARLSAGGATIVARPVGGDSGALRAVSRGLVAELGPHGAAPTTLELGDGLRVRYTRRGVSGPLREERGQIVAGDAHAPVEARVFAHGASLEELFVVRSRDVELGYDLDLDPGLALEVVDATSLRVVDARGTARAHLVAARGWDAEGQPLELAFELDARGVRLDVASEGPLPYVIDPAWSDAAVPLKLRRSHTATLLPSGEILVVGGDTGAQIEASAELYDPSTGRSRFVSPLTSPRSGHTATLLADGRVLLTGGRDATGPLASTELFDPITERFEAGPELAAPHEGHVATLLDDDRVLVVGQPGAELFDPATDALSAAGALAEPLFPGLTAAKLLDGRVLLLGIRSPDAVTSAQLFDPSTGAFAQTGAPTGFEPLLATLTTLRDGRVLGLGGCPCVSVGGPTGSSPAAELFDPAANGGVGAFSATGSLVTARLGHTATLLPSGKVLVTGGDDAVPAPEQRTAELYDPAAGTFSAIPEQMSDPRGLHTATLLPSGDVLLLGGEQASAERYVDGNALRARPFSGSFGLVGRAEHTATTLLDGTVLLAGGELDPLVLGPPSAERFDPSSGASTATGELLTLRRRHTATLLADGRVLLAGGSDGAPLASTELFDPAGAGSFSAGPTLAEARERHSATLLADGRVLLAGGVGAGGPLSTAQLYDPASGTLSSTGTPLTAPLGAHGAARLADGRVLLVGPSSAQVYDPRTDAFASVGAPGISHVDVRVSALPDGGALVIGGASFTAERFDPQTDAFSFAGAASTARFGHTQLATATGQVLVIGGHLNTTLQPTIAAIDAYDPLTGGFYPARAMGTARTGAAATLLRDGDVLVTGGYPCLQLCFVQPTASIERLSPDLPVPGDRPVVTGAPAVVQAGTTATITGLRLRGLERSGGGANASSAALPTAIFRPLEGGGLAIGELVDVGPTSATWRVPVTGFNGAGYLHVALGGALSDGVPVRLDPAADGTPCQGASECESAQCADGVCCDAPCDGACQGCTAARKGSGVDGVCGDVPPALDPLDACELSQGAPCLDDGDCATGQCIDGVCCSSACPGQCEACDVAGSVGTCVPVLGPPHGDRAACDAAAPADPCDAALCDGVDRASCAATVGPCVPFACGPAACFDQCETDAECAVGYHCEAGACVLGSCDGGSIATTPEGVEVDCAPYRCQPDGSCRASCGEVSHCVDPFACDFDGRCVPRPPPDTLTSCSCELAGAPSGGPSGVFALGLLALAAWARRRPALRAAVAVAVLVAQPSVVSAQPSGAPADSAAAASAASASSASSSAPAGPDAAAPPAEPTPTPSAEGDKAEAKARFDKGIALVAQQAWSAALAEFLESRRLYPTRNAGQNAAFCLRQLGRFDEALDLYEGVLRDYPELDEAKKREVSKAVGELRALVGSIDFDAGEPGAVIVIDGRERGVYPPEGPLRVAAGAHVVRVFKKGFAPFEARVDVPGRGLARLDATLSPLRESGTLRVEETGGASLGVYVDNVHLGETPFEGELGVGPHVVVLRGEGGLGTPPTAAPIELSRKTALRLTAVRLDASLRVEPTPAGAAVWIDGVPVGRGTWDGALPAGAHRVDVVADGYLAKRLDLRLDAGPQQVERPVLERDEDDARWRVPSKFTLEASGSLGLFPSFLGNVGEGCDDACSRSFGTGALAVLHAAYELGGGLGFGVSGGYLHATQSYEGRSAAVRPVGLPARQGRVNDELALSGALVLGHGSYHFDGRFPVLVRLGVGALIGSLSDERVGSFELDNGLTYQAGPVAQSAAATYLVIDPEVRVGYPLTEDLEVSLGLQLGLLVALDRPRWDPDRAIDAADDGIGAFEGEDLTGAFWVIAAPGVGLRYAF